MQDVATTYIEVNKKLWNERTAYHINSDFYDMPGFLAGATSLKEPELQLLGQVKDKTLLHLQCHFGQDTLSLARMDANVTGVDFSDAAIDKAKALAAQLNLPAQFVCCDVYDTRKYVPEQFDIVFTSYGVVGWLPKLEPWAKIVADSLKLDGSFVFAEFHPAMWMLDSNFEKIVYSYFNREVIIEQEEGTYADRSAALNHHSITWNHSLHEVIQSLLDTGLKLESFMEYDWSPYNIFNNGTELEHGKYVVKGLDGILPLVYTLKMTKQ